MKSVDAMDKYRLQSLVRLHESELDMHVNC